MSFRKFATSLAATALLTAIPLFAQNNDSQARGKALVTVVPKAHKTGDLTAQNLSLKVDGKEASITGVTAFHNPGDRLEVVIMIDSGARTSISTQLSDISDFIKNLPPNAKVSIGYMENGVTQLTGPLTTDHQAALKGLHIPIGIVDEDASPYFCLSDLAKHWPSNDPGARREVVMITDGFDYYYPSMDLQDPYMEASINDSVRAGITVYTIYWMNKGFVSHTMYGNNVGQNLLLEVTQATGGNSYWEGLGNPVSFQPYFKDLMRRFQNQYEVGFTAPVPPKNRHHVVNMKLNAKGVSGKVVAPQQVYVGRPAGSLE
ncbi:MAG: hypothetical protein ACLGSD_19255 [Acidobacteriota bacterium]